MAKAMRQFNIHEAKTHLSRLVDEAVGGEPFVIAKRGREMVQVIPMNAAVQGKRRLGLLEGMYPVPENFDEIDKELDEEVQVLMFGEEEE
jgi:prevent-host-death family protein